MHHIILEILRIISRLIIIRHHPVIIGVTGTVGKTTITTHIAQFLSGQLGKRSVQYSLYHYNGEYGLPLTIIGVRSPLKNPFLWIWVFCIGLWRIIAPYPRYLVLEYGIDHPGEMDFLLSIAHPDIAILTPVESNHLEQFTTLENYRSHKIKLVTRAGSAIVHESLRQYIDRDDVVFYSLGALSDVDASSLHIDTHGTGGIVHFAGQDFPVQVPAIGAFQIENILPLYSISQKLSIDLSHIAKYALHAPIESGRSVLLPGICDSMIIDGSYNGGYLSIREGVSSMRSFLHSHRIIFFLGDMRELGKDSENIHHRLGQDILDTLPHDADISFFLVGPMMRDWVAPILDPIYSVESGLSSREIGQSIRQMIEKDKKPTIVYAKGSQNTIFLEEGLKYLLDNPRDQKKLPRQSESWMEKKEVFFRSL